MYETLESCAAQFNELRQLLADPDKRDRVDALRAALAATAANIAETPGTNAVERDELAKLYRGMLAAERIIAHLQEKRSVAA